MAITETRSLPAQFIEDIGKDYAKQLAATTSVGIDTSKFAPTVAGQDPLQQRAATLAGSGVGSFEPFIQAAQQQATAAGQTVGDVGTTLSGIAGLTGAYLGYKDQKRVNEALQKRYEDYRRAEEAKRKQYTTGQGLQGITVSNRTVQQDGTGITGLNIRTNPQGVQEIDYRENGGFVPPIGIKEKADDIPAMLSNNEFVFTADAVRGAGDGDVKEGAKKMYAMMKMYEGQA